MNLQTSDNVDLFYETYGSKADPAMLLIHGLGADHQMWQPQIENYPQAGFFVIVPDMRGHGRSSLPEAFSIRDCARDMHELLEALEIDRAHVIGVSMGGMIAQQFAADYPEQAATLIVVDSLSGAIRPVERFNAWLAAVILAVFPAKIQVSMIESAYKKMGKADVGAYLTGRLAQMDNAWVRHLRQQVNAFNICGRLAEIHAPTLVLVGDRFGALAMDMARTTAEGIASAAYQVLPGGGDPSNLMVPDAFDKAVLAFIRSNQ
jgi:3-oxoadipate enol-lactonase